MASSYEATYRQVDYFKMKFRISRITCTFVTESIEALQISMQNKLKIKRLVRQANFQTDDNDNTCTATCPMQIAWD